MGTVANFNLLGEDIEVEDTLSRKSIFRDKKWVCFGDSTAAEPGTYINKLIDKYNCNISNQAVSGTSLVASLSIIQAKDITEYDGVIINFGINDWQASAPLWFVYGNKLGFIDSLETLLDWITNQGKQAFVIFPWWCHSAKFTNEINEALCDLAGYIDCGIEVCEKRGVQYLNLYTYSGINETNYKHMLSGSSEGIYVHALDHVNEFIAAGIFNGDKCNGKCHTAKYKFEPCLYDNAVNSLSEHATTVADINNAAYNGQLIVANIGKTVKTCTINTGGMAKSGEWVTVSGVMILAGIFNFSIVGETTGYKVVRRIEKDTWRYGTGKFRFSFKIPNGERFYIGIEIGSDKPGVFLVNTEFFTDNEPVFLSLPEFANEPLTLSENVKYMSQTYAPSYEINKYGIHFGSFVVEAITGSVYVDFARLNTKVKGLTQIPATALNESNDKTPTVINIRNTGYINSEGNSKKLAVPSFDIITSYC